MLQRERLFQYDRDQAQEVAGSKRTKYLKAALEDEDEPRVLLMALRGLAQAQGIAKVAKAAGIERESLYRALSVHGNPRMSTFVAVTRAIGLRLTVQAAP
ncbi:MAG: addiction module antidote protein [Terriglobia bacterium]